MLALIVASFLALTPYQPQDGDIIFHTGPSSQSEAIQIATESPYSHVGVVHIREGKPFVYEAISTVSLTPLRKWIARGNKKHFMVKRLKSDLPPEKEKALHQAGKRFQGLPYDLLFEWSDNKMYCSELVWKIYKSIGIELSPMRPMKDYKFDHPVVQKLLRARWGKNVDWDEPMVAPADLVKSKHLIKVFDSRQAKR
jgi:hypothetical protein